MEVEVVSLFVVLESWRPRTIKMVKPAITRIVVKRILGEIRLLFSFKEVSIWSFPFSKINPTSPTLI